LSPVIITVRMPIRRISSKRARIPDLTTSLRWMTPSTRSLAATTSGVPPDALIRSTISATSAVDDPVHFSTAAAAPLRIRRPPRSTPLIRV
jgi:hypothetical protein